MRTFTQAAALCVLLGCGGRSDREPELAGPAPSKIVAAAPSATPTVPPQKPHEETPKPDRFSLDLGEAKLIGDRYKLLGEREIRQLRELDDLERERVQIMIGNAKANKTDGSSDDPIFLESHGVENWRIANAISRAENSKDFLIVARAAWKISDARSGAFICKLMVRWGESSLAKQMLLLKFFTGEVQFVDLSKQETVWLEDFLSKN